MNSNFRLNNKIAANLFMLSCYFAMNVVVLSKNALCVLLVFGDDVVCLFDFFEEV